MTTESFPQNYVQSELSRRIAAVAMFGAVLVGCSNNEAPNNDQIQTAPSVTPESLAPRECSFRFVQPGFNLSEYNQKDLTADLEQITQLYQSTAEIGVRDMVGVGRIIKDSYQDPLYVQAISQARERIADGQSLSVDELLELSVEVPESCDDNHIEKSASQDQIRQTVSLSQSLTRQLGSRLGNRASSFARRSYETLQREIDNLRDKAEEAERQPS